MHRHANAGARAYSHAHIFAQLTKKDLEAILSPALIAQVAADPGF